MDIVPLVAAGISVVSAAISAMLVYVFAVRSTRKSKLFDAKLEAYSTFAGAFQKELETFEQTLALLGLNDPQKATRLDVVQLGAELIKMGDTESNERMTQDYEKGGNTLASESCRKTYRDYLNRAGVNCNRKLIEGMRELNLIAARIRIIGPSAEVASEISRAVEEMIRGGDLISTVLARKTQDQKAESNGVGEGLTPSESSHWTEQTNDAYMRVVDAMYEDLKGTL